MKIVLFSIMLILIFSISTIPASFAPSHPVGGQTIVEEIEEISPTSTFTCDRDSQGNLLDPNADRSFCDFQDGLIDCNNPFDHFHNPSVCDALAPDNTGFMNLMILIFIIIIVIVIIVISVRRR